MSLQSRLEKGELEFPLKKLFFDPDEKFKALKESKTLVKYTREKIKVDIKRFPPRYFFEDTKKDAMVLTVDPSAYDKVDIITDYFTEFIRIMCWIDGKESPQNFWNDRNNAPVIWKKAVELAGKDEVNEFHLREAMYQLAPECTQFKASLTAKAAEVFAEHMGKDVTELEVLDSSSGWGDRLIGFLSCNVKSYTGVDPNTLLQEPYKEIIKRYAADTEVRMIPLPFESVEIDKKFDLAFTSPPFANYEHYYTNEEDMQYQSGERYSKWAEEWLYPMVDKLVSMIKPGGLVALYLADTNKATYTKDLVMHMKRKNIKFLGVIACRNGKKRPIPLWVWQI